MARFSAGDKVFQTRGTFLQHGVFVTAKTPMTVLKVTLTSAGEPLYDLQYLDRESMPHTIEGLKESELKPA